ncbi:TPA: acyltransferase family protein [Enterobacter ludwigii]
MMDMQRNRNCTIWGLQYMRGIAALMVVLFHLKERLPDNIAPIFNNGRGGVDIFFIISGFIIYFITQNSSELNPKKFIIKRAFRIFPLYWFIFLLSTFLFFTKFDLASVIRGFFLFHHNYQAPAPGFGFSMVGVAWTLTYEIYFYAIFLICSLLSNRFRGEVASVVLLTLPVALQYHFNGEFSLSSSVSVNAHGNGLFSQALHIVSNTMIYEFVLGIILCKAYLYLQKSTIPVIAWRTLFWISITLSVAIFCNDVGLWFGIYKPYAGNISNVLGYGGFIFMAIPFALMFLFYELSAFKKTIHPLMLLGNISFSLYLCHWFVNRLFTDYMPGFNGTNSFFVILVLSFLMAYVCHILIEKPGVKLIRRKHSGPALS